MKFLTSFSLVILILCACNQKKKGPVEPDAIVTVPQLENTDSTKNFFPVTNFIRGQIQSIVTGNVNPLLITEKNGRRDSSWLKMEEVNVIVKPFLAPVIDTQNVKALYVESSFLDESINAFTFSYDAKSTLPDSIPLKHWDVYVNPTSNEVQRVYMVKTVPEGKQLLLTWQADKKWCSMVVTDKSQVLETKTVIWTF